MFNDQILELKATLVKLQDTGDAISQEIRYKDFISQIEGLVGLQEDDMTEGLYARVTRKVVVHPDRVLEIHLSFMTKPIYMQYDTSGRGDTFTASFTIINKD